MNTIPEYLVIGHVTLDLLPGGRSSPGGTALYAARTVQRLGRRAAIVTAATHVPPVLADLAVALMPAREQTTLAHTYVEGRRLQTVISVAPPLILEAVSPAWRETPIVHLGPVLGECDLALVEAFPGALIGASAQGWLRSWRPPLPAPLERATWLPDPALLARLSLLTLSIEDIEGDETIAAAYAAHCPLVVLTRGADELTLYVGGAPFAMPAYPAFERDPNGAGDVFTAAMLVRLHETGDPFAAARFGAAAAACAVESFAFAGLPDYATVLGRMAAW